MHGEEMFFFLKSLWACVAFLGFSEYGRYGKIEALGKIGFGMMMALRALLISAICDTKEGVLGFGSFHRQSALR